MSANSLHVRRLTAGGVLLATVVSVCLAACSLNPQPIPPGDQVDGAVPEGPGGSDSNGAVGEGGGGGAGLDAARTGDTGSDAPTGVPPADGGADASDAGPHDASDGGG